MSNAPVCPKCGNEKLKVVQRYRTFYRCVACTKQTLLTHCQARRSAGLTPYDVDPLDHLPINDRIARAKAKARQYYWR